MPRSVELFAGGGGMALGLHQAGFQHAALIEIDAKACTTLRRNSGKRAGWKLSAVMQGDAAAALDNEHLLGLGDIDAIAGGPPCQPFSLGGVHAGMDDSRNLFPVALNFVRALQPKLVIFENVPGLLRPSFAPYFDYVRNQLSRPSVTPRRGELWSEHASRLARTKRAGSLSYQVHQQVINAADLGAPQTRRRVFLMAVRDDIANGESPTDVPLSHSQDALLFDQWVESVYWESHGLTQPSLPDSMTADRLLEIKRRAPESDRIRWRTVRDAIRGLPEPIAGQEAADVLNHIGIPGARSYKGHTGSHIDAPSKTLKAGVHGVCGGEAMIRFVDDRLRYMTVRESARIQGFPDWYVFEGARSHAMRHIGNAVAVDVARALGSHLRRQFGI